MNESNHGSNTGSIGRLMSPSEVREATQGRTDLPENMKTQWYLCGDVPEDVWNKLISCADEAAFRITSFTTPNHTAYVVFTMQIDDAQIRFLLPLGKSRETQFLSDANRSGVLLSLAKDNSHQALIRKFALQPGNLGPVLHLAKASRVSAGKVAITEELLAASVVSQLLTVPSAIAGQPVTRVCVIAIFPEIVSTFH